MNLDLLLGQQQLASQKLRNLDSLVALQLNDLAQSSVLDNVTVTGEILLQNLQDFLQVVLRGQALHSRQGLTTVTLLDTDVDVVGLLSFRITGVSKGIWGLVR